MSPIIDAVFRSMADAGSLRALARSWDVSPSLVSMVLSGQKQPGPRLLGGLMSEQRASGMLILVSGATKTFRRFLGNPNFGHLKTPRNGNNVSTIVATRHPWAADNDCFSGFDEVKFRRMLGRIAEADTRNLLWVACPDVVADCPATLARFEEWQPQLAALGLPVALVGQDGAEAVEMPWDRMQALFIGGSTDWKLSASVEGLVEEAKARGKWVHMGRVNTAKRLRHAWEIGCDSVDGTAFSRWPDKFFPEALRTLSKLKEQPALPGMAQGGPS